MMRAAEIRRRLRLLDQIYRNRSFPPKVRAQWNALNHELENLTKEQ